MSADLIQFYLSIICVFFSVMLYALILTRYDNEYSGIKKFHIGYILLYFAIFPIIHVQYDFYLSDIPFFDPLGYFFESNIINSVGILFALLGFLLAGNLVLLKKKKYGVDIQWKLIEKYALLSFLASAAILTYSFSSIVFADSQDDTGFIFVFIFIESAPMMLIWYYFARLKNGKNPRIKNFYILLMIIAVVALIFSGLRGSRISVIVQIVSFLIMYSYYVKPIKSYKIIIFFLAAFFANSIFSVYKYGGVDALNNYYETGEKPVMLRTDNPTLSFFLHDLGRSDIQALVVNRVSSGEYQPPYYPHTYLYGLSIFLPKSLRSEQIYSKRDLGTKAQYGNTRGEDFSSSRIYGLTAESILNFGFLGVPISFFIFGFVHRKALDFAKDLKSKGLMLTYPFFFFFPVYMLFYDFDNLVFQSFKVWIVPIIILFMASRYKSNRHA